MDNVVKFPRKPICDDLMVYTDEYGDKWFMYSIEYKDADNKTFTFSIWARSFEDAENRLQCVKNNGNVCGEIIGVTS